MSATRTQLSGRRILVTGVTGQIAFPLATALAEHNEVFGVARLREPGSAERLDAVGIRPVACDLADGDLSALPTGIDHVVHLAVYQQPGLDFDTALRVNAEGTGLLLLRYRECASALVMSTHSVYRPHDDHLHVYREDDPLGDCNPVHAPTYGVAKLGQEAVARTCARMFDLPVVIARMNASYGPNGNGGLPGIHLGQIAAGQPVTTRWAPCPYQPIHTDDISAQVPALLAAATSPATIINWAGDETVSVQEWCAHLGFLLGVEPRVEVAVLAGTLRGSIADVTQRRALTGPCRVTWREGLSHLVDEWRALGRL